MKTKKYVVNIIKSVVVKAIDEKMAKKIAGRFDETGIPSYGDNHVTDSSNVMYVTEIVE